MPKIELIYFRKADNTFAIIYNGVEYTTFFRLSRALTNTDEETSSRGIFSTFLEEVCFRRGNIEKVIRLKRLPNYVTDLKKYYTNAQLQEMFDMAIANANLVNKAFAQDNATDVQLFSSSFNLEEY